MAPDLDSLIAQGLPSDLPATLGVAVSGGGDSVAMLLILRGLSDKLGMALACVTVDHGLRTGAAQEAASVAALCKRLGLPHETLRWDGWDGRGNTQNAARAARYRLMAQWAQDRAIPAIALGHTQDDQAETVLMRLARGAGVDGLSAMAPDRMSRGMRWLRPMLSVSRADLRAYLGAQSVTWHDDPTNDDDRFDRIKARKVLDHLAPLGIDRAALAQVAQNMRAARAALEAQTASAARDIATARAGGVAIAWGPFQALPDDIARRLVLAALKWVSGAVYAPRARSLAAALDAVTASGSATLEGCRLLRQSQTMWVFREFAAVATQKAPTHALWDDRWVLHRPQDGRDAQDALAVQDRVLTAAALGPEGLAQCPDWRAQGLPRALLLATPAVWDGDVLVAAPLAGKAAGWRVALKKGDASFLHTPISH